MNFPNHHIYQLVPAPGFRVFQCVVYDNAEVCFEEVPVLGWGILRPMNDDRQERIRIRDKYDPLSDDRIELYVWGDADGCLEAVSMPDFNRCLDCNRTIACH